MSTRKGGDKRTRSQKHKNEHAFKNNKYDSNSKAKLLSQLKVANVCQKCKDVIEWKIKYDKYKPLTAPRKCVKCSEKKVKYAYHVACKDCVIQLKVCAKCLKEKEIVALPEPDDSERQRDEAKLREELKGRPLRQQKTFWRQIEKDRMTAESGLTPKTDPGNNIHEGTDGCGNCDDEDDTDSDDYDDCDDL